MRTAGLTLDFTVVHPVGRRDTEYACDENALHRACGAKVTKHHGWLQAKNYWFEPVVAATSGALHPETLRLLSDFARLKTDAVAPDARAALLAPRRNVRSTPDGGAAVQPPGLSYTAHWEALGSALCLLTTRAISCTGPVWGRGSGPSSVGLGPFCYVASLLRSPGPCLSTVFRSVICGRLSLNGRFSQ
jgi:hypothetical protein